MANVDVWIENGDVRVSPETVHVSSGKRESVVWRCEGGVAHISFVKGKQAGGPFLSHHFETPAGGFVGSGPPVRGLPGDCFKYTVTVTLLNDKREYPPLDPQVIVDNGG